LDRKGDLKFHIKPEVDFLKGNKPFGMPRRAASMASAARCEIPARISTRRLSLRLPAGPRRQVLGRMRQLLDQPNGSVGSSQGRFLVGFVVNIAGSPR
jgi:hypothetical protein